MKTSGFLLSFCFLTFQSGYAQYLIDHYRTSADAIGFGEISSSFESDNATATIGNPAQLGLFSLNGIFNASTYATKTHWMSSDYMSLNSSALNLGLDLTRILGTQLRAGVGVGYSTTFFDLGTFQDENSRTVRWEENQKCLTIGAGIDWLIKVGLGYNMKYGNSVDPIPGTWSDSAANTNLYTSDFGIMVQVPILEAVSPNSGDAESRPLSPKPFANIGLGYAKRNIGGYAPMPLMGGSFPQDRTGNLGLNFELGLRTKLNDRDWDLLSLAWARESEASLVATTEDTSYHVSYPIYRYSYANGFGSFRPIGNLILGKSYGEVGLRKGWQVEAGEAIYVRGGSVEASWYKYYTIGFSLKLNGFMRFLTIARILSANSKPIRFLLEHFDMEYHYSEYETGSGLAFDGTKFKAINIVIR